jgi:hypothetical protein
VARLLDGVGGDRSYGLALEPRLVGKHVGVARADSGSHPRSGERLVEGDPLHARGRVRGAKNGGVQHPGQPDVGRVARLASSPQRAGLPGRRSADDLPWPGRPLLERVLLDDEPDLFVAPLDLLLGADQPCHVEIASSIFGYVPQRQRFPAIACRISSELGLGLLSTRAEADTICPGVQKPH